MTRGTSTAGVVALERALSKLGVASRGETREYVAQGRVAVNGVVVRDVLVEVSPERDVIALDGVALTRQPLRVVVLNKPRSTVTTRSDERGRATVYEYLSGVGAHVSPVGRLDYATTGLLLFTNATRLIEVLTNPVTGIEREYVVTVRGLVTEEKAGRLTAGVSDEGEVLWATGAVLRKASGKESHLIVTLTEGRNREVRRLFRALGHEVTKLKRIRYGGVRLGELAPGAWRELSEDEDAWVRGLLV